MQGAHFAGSETAQKHVLPDAAAPGSLLHCPEPLEGLHLA